MLSQLLRNKDRNFINTLQGKESCATGKWYIAIVTVGVPHLRKQGKKSGEGSNYTVSKCVCVRSVPFQVPQLPGACVATWQISRTEGDSINTARAVMWETKLLEEKKNIKKHLQNHLQNVFSSAATTLGRVTLTTPEAEGSCFDKAQVRCILWAACQAGLTPWQIIKTNW